MPYHVAIDKVTERYLGSRRSAPPAAASGRATRTRSHRIGIRVADVRDPRPAGGQDRRGAGIQNQVLVMIYNHKALDATRSPTHCWLRPRVSRTASPTPACCSTPRWNPARPSCSRVPGHAARRRPRHLSVRRRRPIPPPVERPSVPGSGRPASPPCSGILKALHHPGGPARSHRTLSTRTASTWPRPGRGGRDHRAAAALWIVRRRDRPLATRPGSTASPITS